MKGLGLLSIAAASVLLIAADHLDAPAVSGTTADITDFYAFQGPNADTFVFVANLQGLLAPGLPTQQATFDENVLVEFNIDTDNDLKEDLVIQAIKRNDYMYFFGPVAPMQEDNVSQIVATALRDSVKISTVSEVNIEESNGKKYFAGPREDPFFFDAERFNGIVNDTITGGFNNPGTDTYAGKNVLSVVIEFPKSLLPAATVGVNPFEPTTPIYNVWVESKRKQ